MFVPEHTTTYSDKTLAKKFNPVHITKAVGPRGGGDDDDIRTTDLRKILYGKL
jgi:hypothetical protein